MARKKAARRASKQAKGRKKRLLLPYPLLIFLLLCAGVFLVAWTFKAGADDVLVTAKVSAAFVTSPASITSPTDGARFSSSPIDVQGICPTNAGYVEIFRSDLMLGSALCVDNGFDMSVSLAPGANSLVARVFNITDDEGPAAQPVTVTYEPPQPAAPAGGASPSPASSTTPSAPAVSPFNLKTAFVYKGYLVGHQMEWPLEIDGGAAPYAVNVDWGDGTSDLISRPQAGDFKVDHTYNQPGPKQGSYTIKVNGSDSDGQTAFLQFFVIVNAAQAPGITSAVFSKPPPQIGSNFNWLAVAWPAYGVVVLMSVSYLLGEREELMLLRGKGLLRRH